MFYEKSVLENGVTVLTEPMDTVRSVALGLWFAVGSRNEDPGQEGMSHFLEHMMFKGTESKTAAEISESFDRIGAELNAFTSKEYTCYYSRMVDEHLPEALSSLTDMVSHSLLDGDAIHSERQVVLEEIARHEDTPDDHVHELFASALWPGHPLGRPVLGRSDTVGSFDRDAAVSYLEARYRTGDMVVAASGNASHDELVSLVSEHVTDVPAAEASARPTHDGGTEPRIAVVTKDTEQSHICWGVESLPAGHEDRFVLSVLDSILGGGMSSRLFQEIREKRGLAYAVYSYHALYRETGALTVYVGTRPDNTAEVLRLVEEQVASLVEQGVSDEELHRAKESIKGSLVLGLENTRSRMTRLGKAQVTHGQLLSIDEIVDRIDAVEEDDLARVATAIFGGPHVTAVIGPVPEKDVASALEG
jgi:predicted Zn-dependent peptidase